jgi:hypothetical protein
MRLWPASRTSFRVAMAVRASRRPRRRFFGSSTRIRSCFDSRARKALGFRNCGYAKYRAAWEQRWDAQRGEIEAACRELPDMVRYAACGGRVPKAEIKRVTRSLWFQRRVLDVMLWTEGEKLGGRHRSG